MSVLSNLKSALSFANEMCKKYTGLLKEWQHNAVNQLNDYCKGNITCEEYLNFVKGYNKVLLQYDYWLSNQSWLQYRVNEEAEKCLH